MKVKGPVEELRKYLEGLKNIKRETLSRLQFLLVTNGTDKAAKEAIREVIALIQKIKL